MCLRPPPQVKLAEASDEDCDGSMEAADLVLEMENPPHNGE